MGGECLKTLVVVFLLLLQLSLGKGGFGSVWGCQKADRDALIKFKHSLIDQADRLSSWKGQDCCGWEGVGCNNATAYVEFLDLRNEPPFSFIHYAFSYNFQLATNMSRELEHYTFNMLKAVELDPSLGELRHLRYLDLSGNDFEWSPIPEFIVSLKHLTYLNLSYACFGGLIPPHLHNLTRLRALDLSLNNFMSHIPEFIGSMKHLRYLNLAGAFFGGVIPPQLGNLTRLRGLDLSWNDFIGSPIPEFIGLMKHLRYLNLAEASFAGVIPPHLGNLTRLRALDLSRNWVPRPGMPDFGLIAHDLHWVNGLLNLRYLDMSSVNLRNAREWFPTLNMLPTLLELHLGYCEIGNTHLSSAFFHNSTWPSTISILDLSHNLFEGPLPDLFADITSLTSLDLSYNNFDGPIPLWLRSMVRLENLRLEGNNFTHVEGGIVWGIIGKLCKLKELDLSWNSLKGDILGSPKNLSKCTTYDLRILFLSQNSLSGMIPLFLSALSSLQAIDLSNNLLGGSLSNHHLNNLPSLEWLDLSFNSLSLNFSFDWKPPFQLSHLSMRACRIKGNLPEWIMTQKYLTLLDFSNNEISGKMPEWFRHLDMLVLNLSYNNFTGPITHFPSNLFTLDLSNNLLSGPIPQDHSTRNGLVRNSLCQLKSLTFLNLQMNKLSGPIPDCWSHSEDLFVIDLSFNELSGFIPMTIGLLPNIEFLKLNSNSLEGKIPATLSKCTNLMILDLGENKLSGEIPWFGFGVGDYTYPLEIIRLRGNQLVGLIPQQLCSLAYLRILDLASNNLTGRIPRCFASFHRMRSNLPTLPRFMAPPPMSGPLARVYLGDENTVEVLKGEELRYTTNLKLLVNLDLSCNGLVGTIPEELMNLSRLIGLNLSHNHLTGTIPEKIGEMQSLESLDLSNNHLSGTIPSSISALTFLSHLNLSYNNLHGPVPTGSQLQVLDNPSMIYVGNPGLCGDQLPTKCGSPNSANVVPRGQEEEEDKEDNREKVLFYTVIMVGVATGFWGVMGVLLLKRRCRCALFQLVEDVIYYLYVRVVVRMKRLRK